MFQKIAQVQSLATFEVDQGGFRVIAQVSPDSRTAAPKSHYLEDGSRVFDVQGLLDRVAETYNISTNPSTYFFEAIRANTTNVPNENNDAFHRNELLRFDVKLGMPVYATYSGKPHHVNHRSENPKAARGVILDSYYNDVAPALDACPSCTTKTAERQNRDESGLHCKKCGTLVKDEFVEILVGIDAKKDKRFAEAVRSGQLRAGSMGCNCLSTTCNVCSHVAYAKPEFCEHIRAGNKGTLWRREGSRWAKTNTLDIKHELQKRRIAYVPRDFCYAKVGDFEVRRAYENCCGVIFDEYSRVDQPADPKALQVEILKAASVAPLTTTAGVPTTEQLRLETEELIRSAAQKESMVRAAQRLPRVPHVMPMEQDGVSIALEPGDDPLTIESPSEPGMPGDPGMPGAPGGMPGAPPGMAPQMSIDQFTEQETEGPPASEEMDLGEMGVLPTPPGASAPRKKGLKMRTFEASYRKWTVQVSEQGNARIVTASGAPVLIVRGRATQDPEERRVFGRQVFASLLSDGLIQTARKFSGIFSPRFAQVVEDGVNDMVGFDDHEMYGSPLEGGETDMKDVDRASTAPSSTRDDGLNDMDGDVRGNPPDKSTTDGVVDHERKEQNIDNVTEPDGSDMREKRDPVNLGSDSVLDDITVDHKEPVTSKRGRISLGTKLVHRGNAKRTAAVVGVHATIRGTTYEIAEGKKTAQLSGSDVEKTWRLLDKQPGTLKLPGKPTQVVTAADGVGMTKTCEKCGSKYTADHKCAYAEKDASAKSFERLQKVTVAKLAKAQAEVTRIQREAEEQIVVARSAAVDSFMRALRLAARRQEVGLEDSPIKQAAEAVLAETREIGRDAASGQPIVYDGMDPELTRYLVAQMFQVGHGDQLNALVKSATSLMSRGDQYLLDAEADAKNLIPELPRVTASVSTAVDDVGLHAEAMRRQAQSGNLHFNPAPTAPQGAEGQDKRARLQHALSGTVVGAVRGRLGLN